jgi:hypothetical protein
LAAVWNCQISKCWREPAADPWVLKERARKAWQAARQRSALPPVMVDKLWSDGLLAARSAPVGVAAVMMYRSENLGTFRSSTVEPKELLTGVTPKREKQ